MINKINLKFEETMAKIDALHKEIEDINNEVSLISNSLNEKNAERGIKENELRQLKGEIASLTNAINVLNQLEAYPVEEEVPKNGEW